MMVYNPNKNSFFSHLYNPPNSQEGQKAILVSQLKPLLQRHWHSTFDEAGAGWPGWLTLGMGDTLKWSFKRGTRVYIYTHILSYEI